MITTLYNPGIIEKRNVPQPFNSIPNNPYCMIRSGVINAIVALIFILLFIPVFSFAEPGCVTVTTIDGSKVWTPLDQQSPPVVTITKTGSSDNYTTGDFITYGIAKDIGTGTENVVIVKISNISQMGDPNIPGVLQMLNPGEDRYYSDQIAQGQTQQYVRLSWNQPSALNLSIYTPDGEYGPYHDDTDGNADNAIFLKIDSSKGLDPGRWYYRVHGDHLNSPIPFQIETWRK